MVYSLGLDAAGVSVLSDAVGFVDGLGVLELEEVLSCAVADVDEGWQSVVGSSDESVLRSADEFDGLGHEIWHVIHPPSQVRGELWTLLTLGVNGNGRVSFFGQA